MASDTGLAMCGDRQRYMQLALFESYSRDHTNAVYLYDLAPIYVYKAAVRGREMPEIIERDYFALGGSFRVTLEPTQIRDQDGTITMRYLGEREQIVEEVVRRLAAYNGDIRVPSEDKLRFHFSLYEVRAELKRVGHTLSLDEIKRSIMLLNEVRITIEDTGSQANYMMSSAALPVVSMRRRNPRTGCHEGLTFVEFNPLVVDAIRYATHRRVRYDILMRVSDPIARWLIKWLYAEVEMTGKAVITTTALDIRRNSGAPEWKKTRNMLNRITQVVKLLQETGVVDEVNSEDLWQDRKKENVRMTLQISAGFMADARSSKRLGHGAEKQLRDHIGPVGDSGYPLVTLDEQRYRLLETRRREAST